MTNHHEQHFWVRATRPQQMGSSVGEGVNIKTA